MSLYSNPTPLLLAIAVTLVTLELFSTRAGAEVAGQRREVSFNGVPVAFRWCPPGSFTMGSPPDEPERLKEETARTVTLSSGFWIMETEITQNLFETVAGRNPSKFKASTLPVQALTWHEAVEFCNTLSGFANLRPAYRINRAPDRPQTGVKEAANPTDLQVSLIAGADGFRLPTEAQWEYACRAGTGTVFSWGDAIDPSHANYQGSHPYDKGAKAESPGKPTPVGTYKPNPWGLSDMHGNLWEWCWDWHGPYPGTSSKNPVGPEAETARICRGGSWRYKAGYLRAAARFKENPSRRTDLVGCRVVVPALAVNRTDFEFDTPKRRLEKLSLIDYPDLGSREDAVRQAVKAAIEIESPAGNSPMDYWTAMMLFENGETEAARSIIRKGIAAARKFIEGRIATNHPNPGYNGFIYWGLLTCYSRWHQEFDRQILDDYRYVFTHAKNYSGSTGNLSMIHTLALFLADRIWGPENLPKDGRFGARGPKAILWFHERIRYTAGNGSPEFASRPYMIYNLGTLLSLDNPISNPDLGSRATMAFEMSLAHAAGTWLRGNWATPAGRSYPDSLTQRPDGGAAMLWFYFGGMTPLLDSKSQAIFAMSEKFRPSPLIVNAATDRSKPYLHRSRFDGKQAYQTSFVNKTYALFSTATPPGVGVWGQTYPYGVMFDQPAPQKGSHLWLSVPCFDDKPLTNWTHGVATRSGQFLQHEGAFMLLCKDLKNPETGFKDRLDEKGSITNKTFRAGEKYVLSRIPAGYHIMINESRDKGRIFLNYGSVLVSITSSAGFDWNPDSGIHSGSPRPGDSEFRVFGDNLAVAIETARPDEFPASSPQGSLDAFRKEILAKSQVNCTFVPHATGRIEAPKNSPDFDRSTAGLGVVTGTYTDRFGNILKKVFDGPASVNGAIIDYESWPLVDNPWIRQERDGNMTVTDGKTVRTYDIKKWTVTESSTTDSGD